MALAWAAATVTSAAKDKVARRLFANTYTGLGTGWQQSLIDEQGASALVDLENYATWFTLGVGTGSAPDAWEPWLIDEVCLRCSPTAKPELQERWHKLTERTKLNALSTYARLAVAYDPSSTTEAFIYQILNNRKYVLSHCISLKPPLFPDLAAVDSAWEEVHTEAWNRAHWNFRRAQVVMTVTRTAFTSGTWATSAKTITVGSTTFTASTTLGSYVVITGGTNAKTRDYPVVSATTTVLTLASDIGATDASTDIEGFLVTVSFTGMESGDSFDGIATTEWYYSDDDALAIPLRWLAADEFACKATVEGVTPDRPQFFRNQAAGGATAWRFSPHPDQTYTLRGEVYTLQPADPSSGTSTTSFDKFAPEFLPVLRRAQLARVLTNHDRHNEQMAREVATAMESYLPEAQDHGEMDERLAVKDVYRDWEQLL